MTFSTTRKMTATEIIVLDSVRLERVRQDVKWGAQVDLAPERWLTILLEELGEAAEAALDKNLFGPHGFTSELVQVAAVAVRAIESLRPQLDAKNRAALEARR